MSDNVCQECGMSLSRPAEYHPYAVCLMFKACKDGRVVRANLEYLKSNFAEQLAAVTEQRDRAQSAFLDAYQHHCCAESMVALEQSHTQAIAEAREQDDD